MKNKKLLFIIIPVAIVFMAGIVFLALWLSRGKLDYNGAANYVGEIIQHEDIITSYVSLDSSFNYDEIDRDALSAFQNSVSSVSSYYESLRASTAMNDEEVQNRYNEIMPLINKLTEISTASDLLMAYVDEVSSNGYAAATDELDALIASSNAFLITLGTDLSDYYTSLAEFEEKYQTGKAENYNTMIEEYGNFVLNGEKLTAKYSSVTFEEVFKINSTDISDYFAKLKELESYLRDKI
ncbi:MAG: hypothetical protein ACK5MU_02210 [Candidatus Saccharimonadales bacterium]